MNITGADNKQTSLGSGDFKLPLFVKTTILETMDKNHVSQKDLLKKSGITTSDWLKIMDQSGDVHLRTVSRIFHAIGADPDELLQYIKRQVDRKLS